MLDFLEKRHINEKMINKLKKIKALAEGGSGEEKNTAAKIYQKLLALCDTTPEELNFMFQEETSHFFSFKNSMEESLLSQIAYKVIGRGTYYLQAKKKQARIMCTELEAEEIKLLFSLYRHKLQENLKTFFTAFIHKQQIFPDETARLYTPPEYTNDLEEEKRKQIIKMMAGIDKIIVPRAAITDNRFFK